MEGVASFAVLVVDDAGTKAARSKALGGDGDVPSCGAAVRLLGSIDLGVCC